MNVPRVKLIMQKKPKISDMKDQPNQTDQTQQVQMNINSSFEFPKAGSSNNVLDDPSLKPSKPLSKKTMANKQSTFRKECSAKSPNTRMHLIDHFSISLPDKNQEWLRASRAKRDLSRDMKANKDIVVKTCAKVTKKYGEINNIKSTNDYYNVCNSTSEILQSVNASKNDVRKAFGGRNAKAGDILSGTAQRKPKTRKYKEDDENRVKDFYERCDITRINPVEKSKKIGCKISYMKMTLQKAHEIYNTEYPQNQVCFNFFLSFKTQTYKST